MFGGGESQGTARVGCSVVEGVLGDKHNTRAAESCHLANNKDAEQQARVKTGLRHSPVVTQQACSDKQAQGQARTPNQ